MTKEHLKVIAGIDTHADTHHVAIITETGRHLADREFLASSYGYRGIIEFMTGFGPGLAVGVEGTCSYGAELARVLTREAPSVEAIQRYVDTTLGDSSVNTCYEVDAAQAFAQQPSGIREFAAISP